MEHVSSVPVHTIGEIVRVLEECDMYMPQIEVNGRFHYIADEYATSGFVECETRLEAERIAKQTRDESKRRLQELQVGEEDRP